MQVTFGDSFSAVHNRTSSAAQILEGRLVRKDVAADRIDLVRPATADKPQTAANLLAHQGLPQLLQRVADPAAKAALLNMQAAVAHLTLAMSRNIEAQGGTSGGTSLDWLTEKYRMEQI